MSRARVKTTILLENENALRKLTPAEGWDVVHLAALALRAAVDQYVEPKGRDKALEVVCRIIRAPLPTSVSCKEKVVNLKEDTEWATIMYEATR